MADTKAQIVISAVDRTRAAFASVDRNLSGIQSTAAAAITRVAALGPAIAGAVAAVGIKNTIDDLDALGKAAERAGVSVESLQGLQFAASLNDLGADELEASLSRLNRQLGQVAAGDAEAAALFDALGVKAQDAAGNLRKTDEVLLDLAERFKNYRDGAAKAALAQEVFGRSGADLLNFLNQGRDGLRDAADEARRLGGVIGNDLTKEAAEFNDSLTRLQTLAAGAARTLTGDLLPGLNRVLGGLVKGREIFGSIPELIGQSFSLDTFKDVDDRVRSVVAKIADARADLEQLRNKPAPGLADVADIKRLEEQIVLLEKRERFFRFQQGQERGEAEPQGPAPAGAQSGEAEAALAAQQRKAQAAREVQRREQDAAREAARVRDAQLAERLAGIRRGLDAEQGLYAFQARELEQVYRAGLVSLDAYYSDRSKLAQQALQAETTAIDQQVAALRQQRDRETGGERVQTEMQINDLLAQRARLEDDAKRAAALSDGERSQARAQLEAELRDLQAQVLELGGNDKAAALARLEESLTGVAITIRQAGGNPQLLEDLRRLGQSQIELNAIRTQQGRITQEAALAEEAYILAAQKRGQGELETERGVVALREQSLQKLRELAQAARELADANPLNQDIQLQAQELANAVLAAEAVIDPALERIRQRSADVAQIGADALGEFVRTGDAKGALQQLEQQLISLLTQILIVEPAARALRDALGGITSGGGAGGGGGFFSTFLSSILGSAKGNAFTGDGVQAFAAGGVVDSPTFFKFAQGGAFRTGVMGEAGPEGVLPLKRTAGGDLGVQVAGSGGERKVSVVNNFTLHAPADRRTQQQIAIQAGRAIQMAMARGG